MTERPAGQDHGRIPPGDEDAVAALEARRPSRGALSGRRKAHRRRDPEQRLAGLAAIVLTLSVLAPWWRDPVSDITVSGLGRLTFIEAALFAVAASVLVMIYQRAHQRHFHLPLSDGTVIAAAGVWSLTLVVFRMADPPTLTIAGATLDYGVRWGAFIALGAAVAMTVAGSRIRRKRHAGEPEALAADSDARAVTW